MNETRSQAGRVVKLDQTSEPTDGVVERSQRSPLKIALIIGLVAAAALTAALLAPEPWPEGGGVVTLSLNGEQVIQAPVTIGPGEPIILTGGSPSTTTEVSFPSGIGVDEPVEARIRVTRDGRVVRPELDQVRLSLLVADGRDELVPVVRWDETEQELVASRRPPVDADVALGLLAAVVILWVTELLPLVVTSLAIPVVLVFAGAQAAPEALAPFFSPIIVLFFAGFLLAEAMRRSKLDHLAAISIVSRAGRSPVLLFAALIGTAAFFSMWMSNTAAVAILIPIALVVTAPLSHVGYRRTVVLGIAYAGTIGGVGSAIGTPANQIAIEFLDSFGGREISFVEWFAFGLPMVIAFLPIMGVYLWLRGDVRIDPAVLSQIQQEARAELQRAGRLTRDQGVVLVVFLAIVVGWITQTVHGFHPGIVALAGAVTLMVLRRILPDDLARISWSSLLTFGGGLTLGFFLVQSGTSDWIASHLAGIAGLPALVAVAIVATVTLMLTTVASNTASAAILIPLSIPLAGALGIDPVLLVAVVAIASSIDFALVIGTPPTMVAYSTRLFTAGRIFRVGILLDVIGLALLVTVVVWIWQLLGIV